MNNLKKVFAKHLRKHRRECGFTQAELAEAVDRSTDMISRLERGLLAPSFDTLEAIAVALRVHPSVLVGGKPSHPTASDKRTARVIGIVLDAEPVRLAQIERLIKALDGT